MEGDSRVYPAGGISRHISNAKSFLEYENSSHHYHANMPRDKPRK